MIWLIIKAGLLIVAAATVRNLLRAARSISLWLLLVRWLAGIPLDGRSRIPSSGKRPTLTQRGIDPTGRVHWWHLLPHLHRFTARTCFTLGVILTVYGLLVQAAVTIALLCAAAFAGAAVGAWHAVYRIRTWQHERHYVHPLETSLLHGIPVRPVTLEVERARDDNGKLTSAVIAVRAEWPAETEMGPPEKQHALEAVERRLAIEAPEPVWQLKGRNRAVTFTHSEPAPFPVTWDDVAAAFAALTPNELLFGLGKRSAPITASYSQSPHLVIPGESGGGKSNTAAFLLLQELARGSLVINLDPKWISHLWLKGLPNVINAHSAEDLHLTLCWLGRELKRRTETAYHSAGDTGRVRCSVGSRLVVLCEEMNYGTPGLKDLWSDIRTKDEPKRSPALAAYAALACAGRASDIHEWFIAQLFTVESTGAKDSTVRSNAGIKAMARWNRSSWDMAVGKDVPMPPKTTTPGRIQVVTGDVLRECQVPYLHLDDDKHPEVQDKAIAWARELAVSGTVAQIPTGPEGVPPQLWPAGLVPGPQQTALPASEQPMSQGQAGTPEGDVPALVTLAEAVARGVFGPRKQAAVRKYIQRSENPPVPVLDGSAGRPHLYDIRDLYAFAKETSRR